MERRKRRNRKTKRKFPVLPVAVGAAVVVLLAVILAVALGDRSREDVTLVGITYLESLEQKDPDEVLRIRRERQQALLDSQREELLEQLKADEISPFALFQDAVIMGDSRAVGFWYFGFVEEARTLTSHGATLLDLHDQLDVLEEMNPRYIYLCYGLNDAKIGFWGSMDTFVSKYMEYIGMLRQRLPDAVIVVSSILPYRTADMAEGENAPETSTEPTTAETAAEVRRMLQIPQWNEALAAACMENNVIFVDNTQISEEYAHLWEVDGIHLKQPFYTYWAKNLVLAGLEEGGAKVEEAGA